MLVSSMVVRLDTTDAVLPLLTDELVERVAEAAYLEFVSVYVGLVADVEVERHWSHVEEDLKVAVRAAARMAWKQIAVGGGARIVTSKRGS